VTGVGLTTPPDHHALDDRGGAVDLALGHHRQPQAARGLGHERHRHHRDPGQVVPRRLVVDVQQGEQAPRGSEHRDRRLHVNAHIPGVNWDGERFGRGQPGVELGVHQQAPDLAVGDPADQLLDVHPAVAKGAALFVRFGDLGLECDDALKAGDEFTHRYS
jgi:hypothetical protein